MYLAALFDKRLTWAFLRANLGRYRSVSSERLRREAGWAPRPMADTVRDTCASLLALGCVQPRR
jgi:hypothetical protein